MRLKVKSSLPLAAALVLSTASVAQQGNSAGLLPASARSSCSHARSKAEKIICANPALAALDRQMAEVFALALSYADDVGELKARQRRWLSERNDCNETACIERRYIEQLDVLGTLTGKFPSSTVRTLCARLETSETRTEALGRTAGVEDINNDGKPETATTCSGGTANIPCVGYVDAKNNPVPIQPQGFEWTVYSALGRAPFRYENRTFVYYSRDAQLAEPSHLSYITPTNRELRVCEFETQVGSAVIEGGHDVCAAVELGESIESVDLANIADAQATAFGRPDTFAKSLGTIDIDNDGLEEPLIELSYDSGGAQVCTFNYFELLAEDGRSLSSSNSAPVRELQGLRADGHRERNCGRIDNRLFKFNDKIYYETNVSNSRLVPHEVRVLEGTAVDTLCTFEGHVTTKVKRVW
jgi:uncharacterized protein